jgi:GNAT superfamily N-acetyltransferase
MARDKVKELKHQVFNDHILTRVAITDSDIVGCATWTIHLGKQKSSPLQQHVRKLTFQERLFHMYLRAQEKFRSWLPDWPKWLEEWVWPASQGRRRYTNLGKVSMQQRQKARRKCLPGPNSEKDYLILDRLAVLPEYTRKGIGRALVQQGLDVAKETGVPIYLISSPSGRALYGRLGFTVLEEYDIGDEEGVLRTETVMKYETL